MLKPIYELTKKGRPFIWEDEQLRAFDEIKSRLLKPPVLSMPDKRGRFLLYSDTIKYATGSALYQVPVLSSYSFNLYYIKGKDIILSDFLSRQIEDDSNLHEIIPISFNIWEILQESYYSMVTDTYKVQTRAQTKAQANTPHSSGHPTNSTESYTQS